MCPHVASGITWSPVEKFRKITMRRFKTFTKDALNCRIIFFALGKAFDTICKHCIMSNLWELCFRSHLPLFIWGFLSQWLYNQNFVIFYTRYFTPFRFDWCERKILSSKFFVVVDHIYSPGLYLLFSQRN